MSTSLSSLFFNLAQECAQHSGVRVQRTHVYQLVAAAMGYGSWESFRMQCVLTDGVGDKPPLEPSSLAGRARQLGLNGQTDVVVGALATSLQTRDIRALKHSDLSSLMLQHGRWPVRGSWEFKASDPSDYWDSPDSDDSDIDDSDAFDWLGALRSSPILRASLLERAASGDKNSHLWLAALLRCQKPNSYLHEEAERGRLLNTTEQGMRDRYLRDRPAFDLYQNHLRAAAESGIALAAIECALVFGEDQWLANADYQDNPELLLSAAENCGDDAQATSFLLRGSELGHEQALEHLAAQEHPAGLEHMAKLGDRDALVKMATHALEEHNPHQAWMWQIVAQGYGLDLQDDSANAYHSEGPHANELYDEDLGGPLHVIELETVELPPIAPRDFKRVQKSARLLLKGSRKSS